MPDCPTCMSNSKAQGLRSSQGLGTLRAVLGSCIGKAVVVRILQGSRTSSICRLPHICVHIRRLTAGIGSRRPGRPTICYLQVGDPESCGCDSVQVHRPEKQVTLLSKARGKHMAWLSGEVNFTLPQFLFYSHPQQIGGAHPH